MAKSINFKTANKFLLNAIDKAPYKKKREVFKKKFEIYEKRMQTNASNFFNTKSQADDFMYTVKTIKKRLSKKLANGTFDQKDFQRQMNGLITRSRNYQKQVKKVDANKAQIENSEDNSLWEYVITHPIKTYHSDECLARLNRSPYTKKEADAETANLPQHNNCRCFFRKISERKAKILIEQDNF